MIGPAWYQRYVNFPVLLLLSSLALSSEVELTTVDRLRWMVVVVLSAAWMVTTPRSDEARPNSSKAASRAGRFPRRERAAATSATRCHAAQNTFLPMTSLRRPSALIDSRDTFFCVSPISSATSLCVRSLKNSR